MMLKVTGVPAWKMYQIMDLLVPKEDTPIERLVYVSLNGKSYMGHNCVYTVGDNIPKYEANLRREGKVVWLQNERFLVVYLCHIDDEYEFLIRVVEAAIKGCPECVKH